MKTRIAILIFLALVLIVSSVYAAENLVISRSLVSTGGSKVSNGTFSLESSIGQPVAGIAYGTNFNVEAGFWYRLLIPFSIYLPMLMK